MAGIRGRTAGVAFATMGVQEPVENPDECGGRHSLFRPLPSECLEPIDTDRPHLTDSPGVVPPGYVQLELGVFAYEVRRGQRNQLSFFNNLYKLGLVDRVDLELFLNHIAVEGGAPRFASGPVVVRSKVALPSTERLHVTLVPIVAIPFDADPGAAGAFVFLGWEPVRSVDVELNAGVTFPFAESAPPVMVASSAVTYRVSGPVRAFGEFYTVSDPSTTAQLTFGTGVLVAIGRDTQFDAGVFTGLWGDTPTFTSFVGFSFRR